MSSVTDRYEATITDAEAQARLAALVPNDPAAVNKRLNEIEGLRSKTITAFDKVNGEYFDGTAGFTNAQNTATGKHRDKEKADQAAAAKSGARSFAGAVEDSIAQARNMNFFIFDGISKGSIGLRAGNVKANNEGILQYHDEDGQAHDLRPQDQAEMDHVDQTCSAGITTGAQEMNAYMRGETDDVPQSLKDMVPEGQNIEGLTRDDYEVMIREQLPAHIHQGILSNQPLQYPLHVEYTPGMFNTAAGGQPLSTSVNALSASFTPPAMGETTNSPAQSNAPTPTSTPKLETLDM